MASALAEAILLLPNRDDSTPVELFVQGIRAWEPGWRMLLARETVKSG